MTTVAIKINTLFGWQICGQLAVFETQRHFKLSIRPRKLCRNNPIEILEQNNMVCLYNEAVEKGTKNSQSHVFFQSVRNRVELIVSVKQVEL